MNRFLLRACLAAWLLAPTVRAAQTQSIGTEPHSGIDITVSRVFDNTPPGGAAPVRVTINNLSDKPGTWQISGRRYLNNGGNLITHTELSVGPGESRTIPLVVFLGDLQRGNNVGIRVDGPGLPVSGGNAYLQHNYNPNSSQTPFLAMSRDVAARSWEPLKQHVESAKWTFDATQFDPADLLDDWRAYAGVNYLVLSDAEWARLPAGVRAALRQWVALGGKLLVASTRPASIDWSGARPASAEQGGLPYGFGTLGSVLWDGRELKPETLGPLLMKESAKADGAYDEGKRWEMLANLGTLKPNAPLIFGFVLVFAALVGPVNLFLFAPPARRHRMFWTTPLIAVGGSLLLMAVIAFQEGTGGIGQRFTVLALLPSSHEAAVIQDQASRTGMLFGAAFRLSEDALPAPLRLDLPHQTETNGPYDVAGRHFSGDWFRSRAIQAQRFTAIRPTRAEVALVGRDAATGAPSIISSIESPLETLLLTDAEGKVWRASDIRTGERITLQAVPWNDRDSGMRHTLAPARESTRRALETAQQIKGPHFTAIVSRPKGEILPTLSSIRWWNDRVVYTGPAVDRTHVSGPAVDTNATQEPL